jgi:hypothetical protein
MVPEVSDDPYVEALVQKADALRLADQKQWLRLGHYREGKFGGSLNSEGDDPRFFLAPDGPRDARAELHATIRGFFLPVMPEPKVGESGPSQHPICRFPARFIWLTSELAIDPARLPPQQCPRFFEMVQTIDPQSVSVVFASYFLNNPASAFGHTFLRFTKARTMAVGERRELLDYSVDFAANVDTGNPVIYAFKGLFGMFPGTIKRLPFYYKVREYADVESRDLWSYELNLTPQQLLMLVAHIWEVGQAYFDYWYLDENCSYRIERLLEVARPDIELMAHLESPVLPSDTVKALLKNPGLVRNVTYRPSLREQFLQAAEDLNGDEAYAVLELARSADAPLPASWAPERRVKVLDAALDYYDMRHFEAIVVARESPEASHKQKLLERRAALRIPSADQAIDPPLRHRPDYGHDPKRLGVAPGFRLRAGASDEAFAVLDFKLAMHDLADPSAGYPDHAQIDFLSGRVRLYPKQDGPTIRLDDFSILQILSLNPMHRFDYGLSWRVTVGAKTLENAGCKRGSSTERWSECLAGKLRVGFGPTLAFADDAVIIFALVDTALFIGDLSGIAESVLRAGVGPIGGLRIRFDPRLIFVATGEALWFPEQQDRVVWQGDGTLRWGFAEQHALSLESRVADRMLEAQLFYLAYL